MTELIPTATDTPVPPTATASQTATFLPTGTATITPLPEELALDPAAWHEWPILPIVPQRARLIYLYGQALGNDPHAFSVLGDCHAEPDLFLGVYETDAGLRSSMPAELQETLDWFRGSFNRVSPTVKPSTTTAALLWPAWHKNAYTCTEYETPIACELRLHKPSFALVHVGTHYESHNDIYMQQILEVLIEALRLKPEAVSVQRISAGIDDDTLIAPQWCRDKNEQLRAINEALASAALKY